MSYTAVPNWLIDQAGTLSAPAFKVAVVICRLTVGWQKDADALALGRLHDLTKLSKPTLIAALRDLHEAGVIEHVGHGPRGMGIYRPVKLFDRSKILTGQKALPVDTSSPSEPVKEFDRSEAEPVKEFDTQKKDLIATPNGVADGAQPNRTEPVEPNCAEDGQLTLAGLPEPPPPVPAAPSPAKPKKPRREAAADVRALYPAIFDLCKSGQHGEKSMACRKLAATLRREFDATPEQVAAFWGWFKVFSRAGQMAARERRPVNAPMPKQVYADWRSFLAWWEAKQAQDARAAETTPPPAPVEDAPREPGRGRAAYLRVFSLPRRDPAQSAD